ncbi:MULTISPECIES: pyocin activator PrtN family protein [Acinetobacter]|uniref:Pyocin activator PrtN family protein n=1 Tax=Acinetobacter thutiue TaxID=2998078 RepID=A0ABT7WRV5_9GAMM|nr:MULTISPECIES: pyocin activator PrtN family protein [Acinetobacter]MCY6413299.1 pyocin activator PrtN family protein [Acinetobacter thutiue]MDH0031537.1 pyocin activator PrtN family protein [Acinetobacter sp. GD04021]MDH0886880.1 pyocin activator PrtN family protein [Acinetobacter sp. GD03873]MDH1083307.1 pyocin activator PrtN family protein [Acinetobacter sp. GD03983]MDH2190196.1 pyocin activator PrtN family protein [Acinetobacter sp. GD03645]
MGAAIQLSTSDYLFMKYRSMTVLLDEVVREYYPHLSKVKVLEKARNQEFPFSCFKLDKSQKAPYFVHVQDLAKVLDQQYTLAHQDHVTFHR